MAYINTGPKLSKRRKLGKNKKKSWRVAKVDDIEEFLEDERRQIRTGGLVAEKKDESLFVLDTKTTKKEFKGSNKVPRKSRKDKPLNCLSLLQPDAHSKAPRKPEADNFLKGKRTQKVLDRLRERSKSRSKQLAVAQRQKVDEEREARRAIKRKLPAPDGDLWADTEENSKPVNLKRCQPFVSANPATIIPHPGSSVNPSYEDHQNLLREAYTVEAKRKRSERRVYNALEAKFPSAKDAPSELSYLQEMSAGLVDDLGAQSEDEKDAPLSVNPPVRREDRKSKKQRRVEMETNKKLAEKDKEMKKKKAENMIYRLPTLKKEIKKAEQKQKEKLALRKKQKEAEKYKTKRLGKLKFHEQDQDLKLSTELVGFYREIKPEGHALNDIYKSLQRRNIVEPRTHQNHKRKYGLKTFEKKTHREVKL